MYNLVLKGLRFLANSIYTFSRNSEISARILGVKLGKRCAILDNPCKIFGSEPYLITLGDHVEITNGVRFITHDGALWVIREKYNDQDIDYIKPINIGNNVFLGQNSIIMPGVSIESDVIIAAGCIVTHDIKRGFVYAGIPARPIKTIEEYKNRKCLKTHNTKGMSYQKKKQYYLVECNKK